VHDDFWYRVSEELEAGGQRDPGAPPWAATAGPRAMGGDRTEAPDEGAAAEFSPLRFRAEEPEAGGPDGEGRWSAWAPSVSGWPGPPSSAAGEPPERADVDAGPPGDSGRSGKDATDGEDNAAEIEAEIEEEEEAAPSPWSIPLTHIGDLGDFDDEDDWQAAEPDETASDETPRDETPRGDEPPGDGESPGDGKTAAGTAAGTTRPDGREPAAGDGDIGEDDEDEAAGDAERKPAGVTGAATDDADEPARPEGAGEEAGAPAAGMTAGSAAASAKDPGAAATAGTQAAAREDSAADAADDSGPAPAKDSGPVASEDSAPAKAKDSGPATSGDTVSIVPGVARYHRNGCILIRFLGGEDLETSTRQEAEANGCIPCRACEPDKPLSDGN